MQMVCWTSPAEIAPWSAAWNALAGDVPFRRWEWYATWLRHYGDHGELRVLAALDGDGSPLAIAPWYRARCPVRGRVLRCLGDGEVCSDYQTILCRPGNEAEAGQACAAWLAEHAGDWDLLELAGVEAADLPLRCLLEGLAIRGHAVLRSPTLSCWRLRLPESWEAYEALLSKSHRKQVRRLRSRVLETDRSRLLTAVDPESLDRGFAVLVELHRRRWEAQGLPGAFASPRFLAFHREMSRVWLQREMLRLHWLEVDGVPVAAEYHVAGGRTVYGYQAGVDPQQMDCEPGSLAAVATLKLAIENGFEHFDFLRGDEPYKAHWRAESLACIDMRAVSRRWSSELRFAAWQKAREARRWWQADPSPKGSRSAPSDSQTSDSREKPGAEKPAPAVSTVPLPAEVELSYDSPASGAV